MPNHFFRKACIIFIVFVGIAINIVYGIELLDELYAPQTTDTVREILISAITLQFGWAAMLLWVAFSPFERRHIILFTALTMVSGNLLYSIDQSIHTEAKVAEIALNLVIGIFIAALFVLAFFLSRPNRFRHGGKGQ